MLISQETVADASDLERCFAAYDATKPRSHYSLFGSAAAQNVSFYNPIEPSALLLQWHYRDLVHSLLMEGHGLAVAMIQARLVASSVYLTLVTELPNGYANHGFPLKACDRRFNVRFRHL